ncbi:MAG TPA: COX15/CtaA family protein, partial [Gammaproteobacteria bacterium]|nr:COX15/CtaA family protein [Gammaproteobacteria bacterium]
MWTVTLLLKPTIVTLHLLMGLLTLALLWWSYLKSQHTFFHRKPVNNQLRLWSRLALVMLTIQIFLGGWTSTHYAALYCPDFPTCQGQWLPKMDFDNGFVFMRESGINYEGGVLSTEAGVAVHVTHRIGAVLTVLVAGLLAVVMLIKERSRLLLKVATVLLVLLGLQFLLGILNVLLYLPLPIAVGHNAGAALLLLTLIFLNFLVTPPNVTGDRHE